MTALTSSMKRAFTHGGVSKRLTKANYSCLFGVIFFGLISTVSAWQAAKPQTPMDLQEFIDDAVQAGRKQIVIPAGTYRVVPRNRQHLVLRDLENIEILAQGVEMICTQTTRALTLANCRNVTLRGLTVDYDPLPYTQGRIVRLSQDNTVHAIELFAGYPRGDQVQDFKYEIFKPDTRTLRFGSYHDFRVVSKEADHIRVERGGPYHGEQVGDIIAIGTSHAPDGQIPHAIFTTQSKNVVLEGITLYASNCFGFFETECERTTYRQCRIARRPAQDDLKERADPRIRSLDADAFHSKFAVVGPQLIECTAHFQADDCINICGSYHMVMACAGSHLRVLAKGAMNIQPGDPLEVVTYDGRRLADAQALSVTPQGQTTEEEQAFLRDQHLHKPFTDGSLRQIYEVAIDRPVDLARGSIIAAANRMGNGFKVTGCDFGYNRSRGILIKASHGEVSHNRLVGCVGEAIKVAPEFWWLEAGSSNDVRITGNIIEHCDSMGIAVYAQAGTGGLAPAGAHRDIVIEGNTFRDVAGTDIWVTSTRGLTLRDNVFDGNEADIKLEHCERVVTGIHAPGPVATFTNPLLASGPDPWAIYDEGFYYYIKSRGRSLVLLKTRDITALAQAQEKVIWRAPEGTAHSRNLWAPEIHRLRGAWYIYYAADDGNHHHHRLFVLENTSRDPFAGSFAMKAQIKTDPVDNWAIDGSVFEHRGNLYLLWSGWEVPKVDIETQRLYIARMSNPWTLGSDRVQLNAPEYDWERNWHYPPAGSPKRPVYVNEGPQMLKHGNKLHVVYSCSGCWTPTYALGMLTTHVDADVMDPNAWIKSTEPVFQQSQENGVYGTGHNCFFKSPDGTEDWILYHANDDPNDGCGNRRSPRAQRIEWRENDMPYFGVPLPTAQPIVKPSGTPGDR